MNRWGGIAGVGGAALLVGSVIVVAVLGLPDASDVDTLTDFADIRSGRIAEHFLYLGALVLFALHVFVIHRVLEPAHPAAAAFGLVTASFGLVILAASSLLHLSTSPLHDLYTDAGTARTDLQAIEYAWHGAQSVFDAMLATGALLVPIGIAFFGRAMLGAPDFGTRWGAVVIGLGALGTVGAIVGIVDPGSIVLALSIAAIAMFHLVAGWRTFRLDSEPDVDLTATRGPEVQR